MARTASSTSQAPLASTRTSPSGPSASRTASRRATSSARTWPRSATLTFAVRHPPATTIAWARSGSVAGTVTLTGTCVRSGSGQPSSAASRAQASQGREVASSYSRNGDHSPQPASPRSSRPSRTVMPRKRVRRGIEKTCTGDGLTGRPGGPAGPPCRWAAGAGTGAQTNSRGAHERGCTMLIQSRRSGSSAEPTTTATSRWPHSGSGRPKTSACSTSRCWRSRAATTSTGIFTPPLITTSSMRPRTWSRPSSSKRPASEVRNQPSTTVSAVSPGSAS